MDADGTELAVIAVDAVAVVDMGGGAGQREDAITLPRTQPLF